MRIKTQHFVPQFYLKYFTSDGDKIFAFDKEKKTSYQTSIKNVACENYFYDDILTDIEHNQKQYLENFLGTIESEFAPFYRNFLKRVEEPGTFLLKEMDRKIISKYLVSQIDRTNVHREESYQFSVEMYNQLKEKEFSDDQLKQMGFDNSSFDKKMLHIESLKYGLNEIDAFTEILNFHIWIVIHNYSEQPFYTSDHPVVKNAHIKFDLMSNDGYGSPGIEIAFPLNSWFLLVLCDREYFLQYESLENKILDVSSIENIEYYNSLQIVSSYRQIFAENNKFELVNRMKKENPSVFNIEKKRF